MKGQKMEVAGNARTGKRNLGVGGPSVKGSGIRGERSMYPENMGREGCESES